jgi:ABC-type transporter Mla MlaB component
MKSSDTFFQARLNGDWTICGIGRQVETLMNYPFMQGVGKGEVITVDCSEIEGIDINGLQLLFVWLHCIRLHGMSPHLENIPTWMMSSMVRLGLHQNVADDYHKQSEEFIESKLNGHMGASA